MCILVHPGPGLTVVIIFFSSYLAQLGKKTFGLLGRRQKMFFYDFVLNKGVWFVGGTGVQFFCEVSQTLFFYLKHPEML